MPRADFRISAAVMLCFAAFVGALIFGLHKLQNDELRALAACAPGEPVEAGAKPERSAGEVGAKSGEVVDAAPELAGGPEVAP